MDEYGSSSEVISDAAAWAPEKPAERKEAEQKEESKVTSSLGVIQEVLDWFELNANLYASVDALGVNESTPDTDVKVAVLLSKKMRGAFQSKGVEFRATFAKYLKEEPDKQ